MVAPRTRQRLRSPYLFWGIVDMLYLCAQIRRQPLALFAVGIALAMVAIGLVSRRSQAELLRENVAAQSARTVAVASPTLVAGAVLELPGRIEAWSRAPIYARVSGYLKRWMVDIGGEVKAGQVLAELETPDLDQQLLQAQAELATARSNLSLAASTSKRWQALMATDSVSKQEAEEKAGDLAAKQSVVNALLANVGRLQALQQYKRLVAPFDGVVTARNTDVGALVNVGMAPGSELFVVSDIHRLRVYVRVPQRQVALIQPGGKAQLFVPELPAQSFTATVQSLAQAIDSGSGAMLVQLAVENEAGNLLSGGFATVRFTAVDRQEGLALPPSALIIGKDGVQVATVNGEGRVQLKRVTIARDHGKIVELVEGVEKEDQVIVNPPDGLENGDQVRIATAKRETAQ
jgi:RND family efflux transporter MFP subunit